MQLLLTHLLTFQLYYFLILFNLVDLKKVIELEPELTINSKWIESIFYIRQKWYI